MFALLETFIAVFETKSFTRAANQCFISQPTATVRIKKIGGRTKSSTLFKRATPRSNSHRKCPPSLS